MSPEDVSRETSERLDAFDALVRKWNPRINLVARGSLGELRTRHVADSMQVFDAAPAQGDWLDLGSGGGFPAIVCAILEAARDPDRAFTLIESDARKSVFLRTAIRELGLNAQVLTDRIEAAPAQNADVITARALAPLTDLLGHVARHGSDACIAVFPKGKSWKSEVQLARQTWHFECEPIPSSTEEGAALLRISQVSHA